MVSPEPRTPLSISDESGNASREATQLLSAEELRRFYQLDPWRLVRDGAATWMIILSALGVAASFQNPLVWSFVFLVIGARQLALSHLVHDAAHYNVSRNKSLNDWLADLFLAAPTLISVQAYRDQHMLHHSYLGDPDRDTDVRAWYNICGRRMLKRTLLTLLGVEAAKTVVSYSSRKTSPAEVLRNGGMIASSNIPLLAYCWWLGAPLIYFLLWLLPIFTITLYLLTLRVIAEHQTSDYARTGRDAFDRPFDPPLTRTITAGPIERFFIGSMNFCYHHEHHLFPGIPYSKLPALHELLYTRGYYDHRPRALAQSYAEVLRELVVPRPPTAETG